MKQLLNACCDGLQQIQCIIRTVKGHKNGHLIYLNSRLGAHVRHVHDHMLAFCQGIETGAIDYNQRHRKSPIETDIEEGLQAITTTISALEQLGDQLGDQLGEQNSQIVVIAEISCNQTINQRFDSNISRELLYLINHAVHHAAYMKLLLAPYPLSLPNSIGIAPGTASYQRGLNH